MGNNSLNVREVACTVFCAEQMTVQGQDLSRQHSVIK